MLWDSVGPPPRHSLAQGFQIQQAASAESGATANIEIVTGTVRSKDRVFIDPSPLPSIPFGTGKPPLLQALAWSVAGGFRRPS
jgi:hypothetical protein